ncbi:hypothetical protein G6F40_017533 [Rhizopus arrhizus]|nr:hypothetical protein G6F40_017533 [Rhizopus arrhizus]
MAVLRAKWPPIIGAGARGGIRCGGNDRAAAGMMEPISRGSPHVQSQRRHHPADRPGGGARPAGRPAGVRAEAAGQRPGYRSDHPVSATA